MLRKKTGTILLIALVPAVAVLLWLISEEAAQTRELNQAMDTAFALPEIRHDLPAVLKDRDGQVFAEEYADFRAPLPLEEIPFFVQELFINSEDEDFRMHIGFDVSGIMRAAAANAERAELSEGGSTITQQLARMRYLTTEKSYERKVSELFFARELEKQHTKDEILEMYLNEMYFGNRVYGIGAASLYYFDRPLTALNKAELAFLSAIPNNPSLYDPFRRFDQTKARQERLLRGMNLEAGELESLLSAPIILTPKTKQTRYPDYSTFVLDELQQLISWTEGFEKRLGETAGSEAEAAVRQELAARTQEVLTSGITIETALDSEKQERDVRALHSLYGSTGVQAAAVSIDNAHREVVSVLAGTGYRKTDFNRAFQAVRPPASAFKPLIVYAPLFEETSLNPGSSVSGGPFCAGGFCPSNYGGGWYGQVSLNQAFRYSYNTPALRFFTKVGTETAFGYLEPFQFRFIGEDDKTYRAAIGGLARGVTPYELASAYSSFADGFYRQPRSIRSVKDKEGNLLYAWNTESEEVWSASTVRTMRGLLRDTVRNGTATAVQPAGSYTGAKTGTSDDYKDFWIAGLSSDYTAAVWMGYDRPASLKPYEPARLHQKLFSELIR